MLIRLLEFIGYRRWLRRWRKRRARTIETSPRLTETEAARRVS